MAEGLTCVRNAVTGFTHSTLKGKDIAYFSSNGVFAGIMPKEQSPGASTAAQMRNVPHKIHDPYDSCLRMERRYHR